MNSLHPFAGFPHKVFLLGFMGSGKTTAGQLLSEISGLPFLDMDHEIEKRHQKVVHKIFTASGEGYFRARERELLEEICSMPPHIIATGGGTASHNDNMDLMNRSGITVYLKCSANELYDWLKDNKESRPLISKISDEKLKQYIKDTLALRDPFYSKAQVTVNSYTIAPYELWERIKIYSGGVWGSL